MTQIDKDEFRSIALKNYHRIPEARGDSQQAYLYKTILWLAEWCGEKQSRQSVKPGYCAIVLERDAASIPGAEKVEYFKDDYTPELGGNLYLADYALNGVFRCRGSCKDLDETICMVREKGLGTRPFIVFDTDSQTVYVFKHGACELTHKFRLRTDIPRPFTIDVFEEMLNDIYNQSLKFPQPSPPIWHEPQNHIPCKETELVIQGLVVLILRARAQGNMLSVSNSEWLTIAEEANNAGRVDIAVYHNQACIVVSELKVLRQYRYPDPKKRKATSSAKTTGREQKMVRPTPVSQRTNEMWALRGLRQAVRYRDADSAKSAALILYDMRDTDADLPSVRTSCSEADVRYLRYFLHNKIPQ